MKLKPHALADEGFQNSIGRNVTETSSLPAYVLTALSLVSLINYLDRTLWSVLAISVKSELQLSDTQIGLLGGFAFAICYATMGLPLAWLADRSSRVSILSTCTALWSLVTAACSLASSS